MAKNKNMSRIEKLTTEIAKARERIAAEEAQIADLQQQLAEVEDAEIIRLVRSQSISPHVLHQMLGETLPSNNSALTRPSTASRESIPDAR